MTQRWKRLLALQENGGNETFASRYTLTQGTRLDPNRSSLPSMPCGTQLWRNISFVLYRSALLIWHLISRLKENAPWDRPCSFALFMSEIDHEFNVTLEAGTQPSLGTGLQSSGMQYLHMTSGLQSGVLNSGVPLPNLGPIGRSHIGPLHPRKS